MITILLFASLKEQAGVGRLELDFAPGGNVSDLRRRLLAAYPGLAAGLPSAIVSINRQFAFDADQIPEGAEVAIFPPVSGGSGVPTICRVMLDAVDMDAVVAQITQPTTGAVCLFTGIVRGKTLRGEAHETQALEYDAYVPMAEEKMQQVAEEIRQRWPTVEGIAIVQRIGRLVAGTPTVWIACAAAHRDTGVFEAARYGIDRLKEIVPIWKKEESGWVVGDYRPQAGD